nr:class I SAM-dependent methyltransferase [uncultured Dysosmobacter sp.]
MELNTLAMVHAFLRKEVRPGAVCIDATAGKGRDTALLCRLAGETGRVLAFDIQEEAVAQTQALLASEGLRAEVLLDSHAHMGRYLPPESVDCIVFNFGRLPGGDPKIFTRADTSVEAIRAGLKLLRPGGVLAIALYYGGENGYEERDRILQYLEGVDQRCFSVLACRWTNRRGDPPMPVFVWKEASWQDPEFRSQ